MISSFRWEQDHYARCKKSFFKEMREKRGKMGRVGRRWDIREMEKEQKESLGLGMSKMLCYSMLGMLQEEDFVPSHFSHVQLFAILWTVTCQAPLSMGFSRQEYWSGLPCPPPGDLSKPGIKPRSPVSPAFVGFFTTNATWEAPSRTLASCFIKLPLKSLC